jgi:hypothetical protein
MAAIFWKTPGGGGTSTDPGIANVLSGVAYKINGTNLVGTLIQVFNTIQTQAVLIGQSLSAILTATGGSGMLSFTQGDEVVLNLTAQDGSGNPINLTAATFSTQMLGVGAAGPVTFGNSQHAIVNAALGQFSLTLAPTDTASVGIGNNKDILTQVTQSGNPMYVRGTAILTVNPPIPLS